MNYTALYYFMNEKHSLVEVKINDLPEKTPKNKLYKWLSMNLDTNETQELEFVSMGQEDVNGNQMNIRVFKNAELRFDKAFAKFMLEGEGHILMNASEELLPNQVDELILRFLKA